MRKSIATALATALAAALLAVVGPFSAQPAQAEGTCRDITFSYKSWSWRPATCVTEIQILLNGFKQAEGSFADYLNTDGWYGVNTRGAVLAFQQMVNLRPNYGIPRLDEDGILGPNTWGALCQITGNIPQSLWIEAHGVTKRGYIPAHMETFPDEVWRHAIPDARALSGC